MSAKICGVYVLVNSVTNLIYVGSSVNVKQRINGHFQMIRQGNHTNWKVRRDAVRYGPGSFTGFMIEACERSYVIGREQFWIDQLEASSRGYNIKANALVTPEESAIQRGKKLKGRVFTPEWRAKISAAKLGKKASLETRRILSEAHKGKCPPLAQMQQLWAGNIGRVKSAETKAKISKTKRAQGLNND